MELQWPLASELEGESFSRLSAGSGLSRLWPIDSAGQGSVTHNENVETLYFFKGLEILQSFSSAAVNPKDADQFPSPNSRSTLSRDSRHVEEERGYLTEAALW